jgi:mannose-6-phosphate isomerase-like protein (cupin superfamily)
MNVIRWDPDRDGPLSEASMRRKLTAMGYGVSRYDYPAGTVFDTHTHSVEKIDAVLEGRFRITMGDDSVVLEPGEAVLVPRGATHSAEVVGQETVVSLDAVRQER